MGKFKSKKARNFHNKCKVKKKKYLVYLLPDGSKVKLVIQELVNSYNQPNRNRRFYSPEALKNLKEQIRNFPKVSYDFGDTSELTARFAEGMNNIKEQLQNIPSFSLRALGQISEGEKDSVAQTKEEQIHNILNSWASPWDKELMIQKIHQEGDN